MWDKVGYFNRYEVLILGAEKMGYYGPRTQRMHGIGKPLLCLKLYSTSFQDDSPS